jgi:hypothetical protein
VSANTKIVDPLRGLGPLTRPLYQQGLLLQDDDLTAAVQYTRDLNRLMFRTLFGCGVMCGLVVTPTIDCCKLHIGIAKGVALDCHGDPIDVPTAQDLVIDPACVPTLPPTLWIVLRGYEKNCAPRMPLCPDDDDSAVVCTRAREGFEIRVLSDLPDCACHCTPTTDSSTAGTPAAPPAQLRSGSAPAHAAAAPHAAPKSAHLKRAKPAAMVTGSAATATDATDSCQCADPNQDCYQKHYQGLCNCDCCDNDWIVLARIDEKTNSADKQYWEVDHGVRRFVRPVLMSDPQPPLDAAANTQAASNA